MSPIHIRFAHTAEELNEWNRFVLSCGSTSFFVTTGWFGSYTTLGIQTRYLLASNSNGSVLGGAALAIFRLGPLRWIYVPHGPAATRDQAVILPALLDAIEAYSEKIGAIFVQVAPFERTEYDKLAGLQPGADSPCDAVIHPPTGADCGVSQILQSRGYDQRSYFNLLSIPRDEQIVQLNVDDLLSTFRKGTRRDINHTLKSGDVSVRRVESLESLGVAYGLLKENALERGYPIRPWQVFRSAVWTGIENHYTLVLIAEYKSEPCSTVVVGFGGGRGVDLMAGTKRLRAKGVYPAHLIQYVAMQETRNRGFFEYDLMGLKGEYRSTAVHGGGIAAFKRGFRPMSYQLSGPFAKVFKPSRMSVYLSAHSFLRSHSGRILKALYRAKAALG